MVAMRTFSSGALTASGLVLALLLGAGPALVVPQAAEAASAPCRVRNITHGTASGSLIRAVERSRDGDHLLVRGTCPGPVVIATDIVIVGGGTAPTLTGRERTRVVTVQRGARVTLRGVLIKSGRARSVGGAIQNMGRLELVDSRVSRNYAPDGGGAIENEGTVTLTRSTLARNGSGSSAGGIYNIGTAILIESTVELNAADGAGGILNRRSGRLTLTDSRVSGNYANEDGGGISNYGSVTLTRSTLSGNTASQYGGGGIWNMDSHAVVTLAESTITGNTAGEQGGGIWMWGGAVTLVDSTITNNTAGEQGGGIWSSQSASPLGSVTLQGSSSVAGNDPDDCAGTPAC
jgi:hypothetical protein